MENNKNENVEQELNLTEDAPEALALLEEIEENNAPTLTREEIFAIAAETVKATVEELEESFNEIEDIDGLKTYFFWKNVRGGISTIINEKGEKLAACSSISYEELLEEFKSGRRN